MFCWCEQKRNLQSPAIMVTFASWTILRSARSVNDDVNKKCNFSNNYLRAESIPGDTKSNYRGFEIQLAMTENESFSTLSCWNSMTSKEKSFNYQYSIVAQVSMHWSNRVNYCNPFAKINYIWRDPKKLLNSFDGGLLRDLNSPGSPVIRNTQK